MPRTRREVHTPTHREARIATALGGVKVRMGMGTTMPMNKAMSIACCWPCC